MKLVELIPVRAQQITYADMALYIKRDYKNATTTIATNKRIIVSQ